MNEFFQLAFIGMVNRLEKLTGEKVTFNNEDFEFIVSNQLAVDFGDSTEGELVLFTVSEKEEQDELAQEGDFSEVEEVEGE